MLAEMTFVEFLNANWASIGGATAVIFTTICGAVAWVAKVIWIRIETYWEKRDQREAHSIAKTDTLIETLTTHTPQQTQLLEGLMSTQKAIHDDIIEGRKHDSDVFHEIDRTKQAALELSFGLESLQPQNEEVKRYMRRARERLGLESRPPQPPPTY